MEDIRVVDELLSSGQYDVDVSTEDMLTSPIDFQQAMDTMEYDDILAGGDGNIHDLADYDAFATAQAELQTLNSGEYLEWTTMPNKTAETPSQTRRKPSSGYQTPFSATSVIDDGEKRTRRPRKQNRSCDQCRASKKACDLYRSTEARGQDPFTSCTTCVTRGLECSTAWLARKKSLQRGKLRAKVSSHLANTTCHASNAGQNAETGQWENFVGQPTRDADIARQATARQTYLRQFDVYVEFCDVPLSRCISPGTMPPCYSLGVTALAPLSNSSELNTYLERAGGWIKSCWETNASSWTSAPTAPNAFRTVSLLDSLFQEHYSKHSRSRDTSINETYKWVAVAHAAQFDLGGHRPQPRDCYGHDLAAATWQRAKEMLFKNIAVQSSFRQCLSLLLFGIIIPPAHSLEERRELEQEAVYALCEGVRRLLTLCSDARGLVLQEGEFIGDAKGCHGIQRTSYSVQSPPPDAKENVLELLGALEWLATMSNAIEIASSQGITCPVCPEYQNETAEPAVHSILALVPLKEREVDDSILCQIKAKEQTLMTTWDSDCPDPHLGQMVARFGSLVVVLWKSLACLVMAINTLRTGKPDYLSISRCYKVAIGHVKAWREAFGSFDDGAKLMARELPVDIKRSLSLCLHDGDLVVLILYKLSRQLEIDIEKETSIPERDSLCTTLRSTHEYLRKQRLLSAKQVSFLYSTFQGIRMPCNEGDARVQSVQDIIAHPSPRMVVQAHTLSVKALADEMQFLVHRTDISEAFNATARLDACVQALQELRAVLVTFPDLTVDT